MDFVDLGGFPGFQGSGVFQPVAACGVRWRPLATGSSPLKKGYGALEAWIMDAWRLGGLEAWSLVALAEAGGLEASRLVRCSNTLDALGQVGGFRHPFVSFSCICVRQCTIRVR